MNGNKGENGSFAKKYVSSCVLMAIATVCMIVCCVLMITHEEGEADFSTELVAIVAGVAALFAIIGLFMSVSIIKKREEYYRSRLRAERELGEAAKERGEQEFADYKKRIRGRVSHSLRMPISIISGYADLIVSEVISGEEQLTYIKKISDDAKGLNLVLTSIISEIEGEQDELEEKMEPINIAELARSITADVSKIAESLEVTTQVVSEPENVIAYANPMQMRRILLNLYENSFCYMGKSGTISINVSYIEDKEIMIVFRDNGVGMDEKHADKVFEEGFTTNEAVGKHGYGLYMCKKLVERHNGNISIKTGIGKGMTTYISIPIKQ